MRRGKKSRKIGQNAPKNILRRARQCRVELLEPRLVLSANASPFPQITWTTQANGIPNLTSFSTAPAMIYLDYDGDAAQNIAETDFDSTPGTFTPYEQQRIYEHWRGLTATFSMFNVGVTTVPPDGSKPVEWIAITNDMITKGGFNGVGSFEPDFAGGPYGDPGPSGQSGSDWHAEGYSHEISHGFGNNHQASYDDLGNKVDEYAPFPMNDPLRAGIMGDGGGTIIKWQLGHSSYDVQTIQGDMEEVREDMDALDGAGDGYRPDDQAGTTKAGATALTVVDSTTQAKVGIIERLNDQDWWSFTSSGGTYNIMVGRDNPSPVDIRLTVYASDGTTILATDDGDPVKSATSGSSNYRQLVNDSHVTLNLPAGTYYLKVESHGNYADQGQYIARVDRMRDGWQSKDVGLVESPGFTDYDPATGTFYVGGSGGGLGGLPADGGDQAQYAYTKMIGNGEIIVRVANMETAQSAIRAGIMVRESLATGAKFFNAYAKPTGGVSQHRRSSTDGNSGTQNSASSFNFSPVWLRVTRVGDVFTAYYSFNGTSWTQINTAQTVAMSAEVYVGLVSTSANGLDRLTANFLTTATFTNVQVIQQADIGVTGGSTTYNAVTDAYAVSGRGTGWGNAVGQSALDSSTISYRTLTGNGSITAHVASTVTSGAAAGIMIRETTTQSSKYFATWVKSNQQTVQSYRSLSGNNSSESTLTPLANWLRIERVGNEFRSYTSDDGVAWTQLGDVQVISMAAKVHIGMMVSSGNTSTNSTTTFDHVTYSGGIDVSVGLNALPSPTNVSVSNVTSTSATISWAVPNVTVPGDFNLNGVVDAADYVLWRKNEGPQEDYDTWRASIGKVQPTIAGYRVERSSDNVNFATIATTSAAVLTYIDPTLTGGEKYYYRVRTNDSVASSTPSTVVTATVRPIAVTGVKVYSNSTSSVVVEWLDTSGETGYKLQRSTDNATWTTIPTTSSVLAKNTVIYVDTGLAVGTKYYYRVITVDAIGDAATSSSVNGFTRSNTVPTNFTFNSTSSTSITFSWDAIAGAVRYSVYRGVSNSINEWQLQTSTLTTPTFTQGGLTAGSEYYYRIVGYDANGVPSQTAEILGWPGLTTPALPSPWLTQDIGSVGISGAAGFSGGTFTVIGGGADIWGNNDELRFVYTTMTGNGFIQARVAAERNPAANYYSRAGIQIRNTLTTGSKQVSLMLHQSDYPIQLQYRSSTGGGTGEDDGPTVPANAPYWLRLERSGTTSSTTITGKVSPDGVTWTTIASRTFSMNATVYIGLALTPRDDYRAHWATFDNVSSTPTGLVSGAGSGAGATFETQLPVASTSRAMSTLNVPSSLLASGEIAYCPCPSPNMLDSSSIITESNHQAMDDMMMHAYSQQRAQEEEQAADHEADHLAGAHEHDEAEELCDDGCADCVERDMLAAYTPPKVSTQTRTTRASVSSKTESIGSSLRQDRHHALEEALAQFVDIRQHERDRGHEADIKSSASTPRLDELTDKGSTSSETVLSTLHDRRGLLRRPGRSIRV